ncbi:nitrate reductase molybdenum cofactor assembly chaperone [Nocardia sp. NPDC058666]|uniref:nitrate reductase molybdenum cofactor assembly chaperone n=1 Tax=Nocardia sp. NPDC058666 TaxID=3346587 RepID=UPI00365230B1
MMRTRTARRSAEHRLTWQAASLLLAYPDAEQRARLDLVTQLTAHLPAEQSRPLLDTAEALRALTETAAAQQYVDTFDLRRRATLLLTYWTDGDTRNRGMAMLTFTQAYRAAGVAPPSSEVPDHLPVVLEFAATVDPIAGAALLSANRRAIHAIGMALQDENSLYAPTLAAVTATLPPANDADLGWARRLVDTGPAAESVGLAPFTLTVPPRRSGTDREPAVAKGLR